jgi:hypothetical protein
VRLYFWDQAWAMFKSAPLLGVGFGQFAWGFLQQAPQFAQWGVPGYERNAHNVVLHLLAETGAAGALFVALALGAWGWRALRAAPDFARWWIVAAVGIVVAHSMVEYPLWQAHFLGPFALLIGLGETRSLVPRQNRIVVVSIAAAVLLGGVVLGSLMRDFAELHRWVYSVPEQSLNEPAVVARQAQAVRRLQPTLLGPYVDLPLSSTIRVDASELEAKLTFNGRVMQFAPIAPVVLRQAALLALAGRIAEAKPLLDGVAVLYPAELTPFAAELEGMQARGLPVAGIAAYVAAKQGKN